MQGLVEECRVERYYIHSVGGAVGKIRVKEEVGTRERSLLLGLEEKIEY